LKEDPAPAAKKADPAPAAKKADTAPAAKKADPAKVAAPTVDLEVEKKVEYITANKLIADLNRVHVRIPRY
jgi:hypothetical protein